MAFSIKQMEDRIHVLQRRRDVLEANAGYRADLLRGAYIQDLNEALGGIIAELAGRLSAAEELLADARRPKPERHYERPE
jgi:hypothetical protein